ncbi:ABC transporter ATP-binding protein [Cellulomonas citrea]|uniref:ABC transporter ATP-binding protein n=1 Tax=Cellulomonas citrea TaxID=1909423 RepID=UPI001359C348|nr:ABC transporter ATP-binding protein [Cellulomonas citrea]
MALNVVEISNVSKRFVIHRDKSLKERVLNRSRDRRHKQDFWALRDVNLDIELGSTVGLVGANGSGKSTLLKMIGGIHQPTTGSVRLRGRLAALLELGAGFHPDLTGRENVYLNAAILGISRAQTDRYFDAIVDFSGIEPFIDTQVKYYSSGMYVRLAFAVAVHVDPDILLVDEVLAVGDEPFQRKCMDRIRGFQAEGRSIVLVSHALDQVADLCDRAVVLEAGQVRADGPPREALRVLREDFEETRRHDVEEARRVSRRTRTEPAPSAEITAIDLVSDGAPRDRATLTPGDDLTVRVHVTSTHALDDWNVGIALNNPLGQMVLGTNAVMLGKPLPHVAGGSVVEFTLPGLMLGEGSYSVDAAISFDGLTEADRLSEGAALTVVASGQVVGYTHVANPDVNLVEGQ